MPLFREIILLNIQVTAVSLVVGMLYPNHSRANDLKNSDDVYLFDMDPRWGNFKKDDGIRIKTDDQVKDGCWTTIQSTKNAVQIELERSGFKVQSEQESGFLVNILTIQNLGYRERHSERCVISYRLKLETPTALTQVVNDQKSGWDTLSTTLE